MSAAETIAAAIEKLGKLKAESTPSPWHYWTDDLNGDVDLWHDQEQRLWIANLGQHENARVYRDADLIVTLHRTIDAQLAILREAQHWHVHVHTLGLDLAKAILGESS